MKNTTAEKYDMFRLQVGSILRKPPDHVSREEREWLPWGEARVRELELACPAAAAAFLTKIRIVTTHCKPARCL